MAATVSAWAKPGAWALDSEEHEEELLQQQKKEEEKKQQSEPLADFPSLAAAAATKSKKKKGQTLSLAEFSTGAYVTPRSAAQTSQARGLTAEDLRMLPTGPRERTAEELDRTRLGGGFRSYGSNDSGRNRYSNGDDSSNPRWGSSRVSDETRRSGGFGRDSSRESGPSRADEIDDWGAAKKSTVSSGFERKERGGGFFDSQSRADESDSWVSNKSFVPSEPRRFGSGGGGFDRERRGGGFESLPREASNGGGGADSDTWGKKREQGSGSGSGRPRLVLQPRTVPVSNGQQNGSETVAKPKSWNPFGEARPREEVLAEKGQDWKEIEEKLESTKIKEMGTGPTDGLSVLKRGFGSGNGRTSLPESRSERNWRKTNSVDAPSPSAEQIENGLVEED